MRDILLVGGVALVAVVAYRLTQTPPAPAVQPTAQLPYNPAQTQPQGTSAYAGYGQLAAGIGSGVGSVLSSIFGSGGYGRTSGATGASYDSGGGVEGWTGIDEGAWSS